MSKLDDLYIKIVKANLIKSAQETAGNPVSTPEEPKNNTLNQGTASSTDSTQESQNQPAGSNTSPTAAKPQMVADQSKKPENKPDENKTDENKPDEKNTESQTYKPPQGYQPQQAYKVSNNLNGLISLAINETKQIHSKAEVYYMNPKIKNKILNKFANKNVVVKFVGSNKKETVVLDNDTYDHYVKAGMEKIYIPLTKNQKQLTVKAKNCDIKSIKKACLNLYNNDYINKCAIIQDKKDIYIVCSTEKDIRSLPVYFVEEIEKIAGVFEIPTENRLSIVPESIFEGEKCFIL